MWRAARAGGRPARASSSIRASRTFTSANSAATKKPFRKHEEERGAEAPGDAEPVHPDLRCPRPGWSTKPGPVARPARAADRGPRAERFAMIAAMRDIEELGLFYLGRAVRPRTRRRDRGALPARGARPHDPRRLRRHDRERQDRPRHLAPRGGGDRRHPGARDRPEGRPREPRPRLPGAPPRGLRAVDRPRRGAPGRAIARRAGGRRRRERWRAGLAASGQDAARVARFARAAEVAIYTPGSRAGTSALAAALVRGAARRRSRADADALRERAQAAVSGLLALLGRDADPLRSREHILLARLVGEAWERGADLDLPGLIRGARDAALRARRRARARVVLPRARALRARERAQQPARLAGVRGVARGRAARRRRACSARRTGAAPLGALDRPPRRRGAHVLRDAAPLRARRVDARAAGDAVAARAPLHGRGVRLPAAHREPALEGPAPDAPEAGARVRPRRRARDPEPGRPRLQGALERRHLVPRPAPDRARPRARGGRARERGGAARATGAELERLLGGLGKRVFLARSAREDEPRPLPDALRALLPARAADARGPAAAAQAAAPRRRRGGRRRRLRPPRRPPAARSARSRRRGRSSRRASTRCSSARRGAARRTGPRSSPRRASTTPRRARASISGSTSALARALRRGGGGRASRRPRARGGARRSAASPRAGRALPAAARRRRPPGALRRLGPGAPQLAPARPALVLLACAAPKLVVAAGRERGRVPRPAPRARCTRSATARSRRSARSTRAGWSRRARGWRRRARALEREGVGVPRRDARDGGSVGATVLDACSAAAGAGASAAPRPRAGCGPHGAPARRRVAGGGRAPRGRGGAARPRARGERGRTSTLRERSGPRPAC